MDGNLVIKVELAGMRQEDLELAVVGNRLEISGQRRDNCRGAGGKFLVMEIIYGAFECVLEIPPEFNLNEAKAEYQNGFLTVNVPKVPPSSHKKKVKVHISEGK